MCEPLLEHLKVDIAGSLKLHGFGFNAALCVCLTCLGIYKSNAVICSAATVWSVPVGKLHFLFIVVNKLKRSVMVGHYCVWNRHKVLPVRGSCCGISGPVGEPFCPVALGGAPVGSSHDSNFIAPF